MTGEACVRLDLLAGLLKQVREIIGEDSTSAMLHFAAAEEGRILGAAANDDLKASLANLRSLVGSELELVEDGADHVLIRAPGFESQLQTRAIRDILTGLLEGLLTSTRHRPYQATLNGHGGVPTVELKVTPTPEAG